MDLPTSTLIRDGDLLMSRANTLELVGATVIAERSPGNLYLSDKVLRIRTEPTIARWLNLFLRSADGRREIEERATGNQLSMRNIGQDAIRAIEVPLPPLAEQRRIVAQIEALFGRTHRARADLERIAPLAVRYREALTERAYEPEPDAGWRTSTAGDLAEIKSGITLGKRYPDQATLVERPYLRVANVQRGHLKLDEIKTIRLPLPEAARLALRRGDILMNEGGDRDKLGRGWVWGGEVPDCIHQNHVFRLRLRGSEVTPYFLSRYANHFGARYFLNEGKQTTNLASISMAKVAALPVPVPPPGDAARIDTALDGAEASSRSIEHEAIRALALLDHLEQRILAGAFRGELVTQDPGDQPAAALTARLSPGGPTPAKSPRRRRQAA